jgi:hypothetical protein
MMLHVGKQGVLLYLSSFESRKLVYESNAAPDWALIKELHKNIISIMPLSQKSVKQHSPPAIWRADAALPEL